jgi:hypothetical protein
VERERAADARIEPPVQPSEKVARPFGAVGQQPAFGVSSCERGSRFMDPTKDVATVDDEGLGV